MQQGNHLDLDFSVSCATFHPTCRKVEIQYLSLQKLIESVSADLEQQYLDDEKSGYEWAEKNAQEKSGGENILYQNIYGQNCAAVDGHLSDLYDIQNMFYQSMLSTAYSYYESILTLIVVEKNLGNKQKPFDALKDQVYSNLQPEVKTDFDYLYDTVRLIRNIITHNYNGTPNPDQIRAAQTETERKRGFAMYNQERYIVEKKYVTLVLDMEYRVLQAICKDLGYRE